MDNVIKELLVSLGFKIDEAGLKNFLGGISSASVRIMALGATMTAVAGVIVNSIDNVAKEAEQLDLLAQRFNTTASAMDDFGDTAEIMGIGQDKAFESMTALNRVVGQAALGIGRGKVIMEKLGVSVKDAGGHVRATTDVMADLQTKLSTMDRGQAISVMERLGLDPAMLRMFNGELGNTSKIGKELSDIDASVGFDFEKNISESKEYMKQQREMMVDVRLLKMWFDKLWEKIATDLMPKVRQGMKNVSASFESFRKVLQSDGKKIVDAIEPIIETIINIGAGFLTLVGRIASIAGQLIGAVVNIWGKLNEATNGWIGYLALALIAWKAFNLGFLLTPIGMIIGLSVAVLALYDDFMTWKEGGDSLIDWGSGFGEMLMYGTALVVGLGASMLATKAIMMGWALSTNIITMALKGAQLAMFLFNAVMSANPIALVVIAIAALIAGGVALIANWSTVKAWFSEFFKWFGDKFSGMSQMASSLGSMFGGGSSATPSPAVQRSVAGQNANVSQQTVFNVNGSQNPNATANAIAGQQGNVNANMARNMRAGAR